MKAFKVIIKAFQNDEKMISIFITSTNPILGGR
jgi:hypothetical protein